MSLDRRMHDGRLRDPWQIPHKNRMRYRVTFYLKGGFKQIAIVGVPPPFDKNLLKYRDEVINVNREDWFRPVWAPSAWNKEGKPIKWGRVLDPKTGQPAVDCRLLGVDAKCLGADI